MQWTWCCQVLKKIKWQEFTSSLRPCIPALWTDCSMSLRLVFSVHRWKKSSNKNDNISLKLWLLKSMSTSLFVPYNLSKSDMIEANDWPWKRKRKWYGYWYSFLNINIAKLSLNLSFSQAELVFTLDFSTNHPPAIQESIKMTEYS